MKKDEVYEILLPQALLYFPQSVSFATKTHIRQKQEHERSYKAAVNLEQMTQCKKLPWHILQRVQGWQMFQSKFWQCVQRTLSRVKRNTMLLAVRILYALVMNKSEQESMKEFVDDEEKVTIKVAKTLNKLQW